VPGNHLSSFRAVELKVVMCAVAVISSHHEGHEMLISILHCRSKGDFANNVQLEGDISQPLIN
jgi:hypothetical protein